MKTFAQWYEERLTECDGGGGDGGGGDAGGDSGGTFTSSIAMFPRPLGSGKKKKKKKKKNDD